MVNPLPYAFSYLHHITINKHVITFHSLDTLLLTIPFHPPLKPLFLPLFFDCHSESNPSLSPSPIAHHHTFSPLKTFLSLKEYIAALTHPFSNGPNTKRSCHTHLSHAGSPSGAATPYTPPLPPPTSSPLPSCRRRVVRDD